MVYGIGCDLCSIARMEKSLLGPHGAVFARRVFGPAEQAALGLPLAEEEGTARRTAHTVASAAADFAAKEAFLKAAGFYFGQQAKIWFTTVSYSQPSRALRRGFSSASAPSKRWMR